MIGSCRCPSAHSCSAARRTRPPASSTSTGTYWAWPPSRCGATTIWRAIAFATAAPCSWRTQVQAGVDPGRRARAGDHRAFVDVQHAGIYVDLRVAAGQLGRVPPVRGRPAAVQQPGRGQHESAGAVAEHPAARSTTARSAASTGSGGRRVDVVPADDDGQVGGAQPVEAGLDQDRQADVGADRPRLRGGHE